MTALLDRRIHTSTIEELKQRADLIEVISEHVALKKRGKTYMGSCPFHEERTPSFSVNPTIQLYHCFGCGASGDAIKFLMELNKTSFRDVVLGLAKDYSIRVQYADGTTDDSPLKAPRQRHPLPPPEPQPSSSQPEKDHTVSNKRVREAEYRLFHKGEPSEIALAWLEQRSITRSMASHYRLGLEKRIVVPDDTKPDQKQEFWAISIPIPHPEKSGRYYIKKRVAPWLVDERPEYLSDWTQFGVPTTVFFTHNPDNATETWFAEGEWDAIRLGWLAKERDSPIAIACSTSGCGTVPPPEELVRLPGQVTTFFDRNDTINNGMRPGDEGAKKLAKALGDIGRVALVPMSDGCEVKGWDVSDALANGFTWEDFEQAAQKALQPNGGSNGGSGNGGFNDSDGDGFNNQPSPNEWDAPVSWNGEIGFLAPVKRLVMESDPHTGETTPVFDGKGKPVSELVMKFIPKCNFDFQVERELGHEDGGGLILQVKRSLDRVSRQKRLFLSSQDYGTVKSFEAAIKKALGVGIVVNLKDNQLKNLIHVRLREYHNRDGDLYQLAARHGQQKDGHWVFPNCQISKEGNFSETPNSNWVFNANLGGEDKMPVPQIAPPNPDALKRLVRAMRRFHGENGIYPAMMVLGYVAAGIHYQEIMKQDGRFPLINLIGDPGSNKSVTASNALSLVGWRHNQGFLHRVSLSAIYETLKLNGSLPLCLDDPTRSRELDELLKGLYDGRARKVRGNYQAPHTPLMVVSNHACGDDHPATLSRLIQIFFHVQSDGDASVWNEMQQAQQLASGALPDLIKLGYPVEEISQLADELRGHLPYAHARVADSLALITWYAMAVARLGDFSEEEIKTYVINRLCKIANDADSQADSLTNFLDKLNALHSESLVGEWSVRLVKESPIGQALAVNMSTVWPILDKQFNPIYSRKVVESLLDKVGGRIKSVQKFHRSKDESLTYQRARVNSRTDSEGNIIPISLPEMVSRRCVLIPANLAQDFISSWRNPDNDPDGGGGGNTPDGGNDPDGGRGGNAPASTEILSVTSVMSDVALVTEKCNQQNADEDSISDVLELPVTSVTSFPKNLKEKEGEEAAAISIQSDAPCERAFQTDEPSLGYTSFSHNDLVDVTDVTDVTDVVIEVEIDTETELHQWNSEEKEVVTDVTGEATGCNRTTLVSPLVTPTEKELLQPQTSEIVYRYQNDRSAYGCIRPRNGKSRVTIINVGELVVLVEGAQHSNPELVYVCPLGVDWAEGIVVKREYLAEVLV